MTLTEKVAYLKGLTQGLGLDEDKKETKVINAIIDILDDMALSLTDVEDDIISMGDELDAINEDLTALEDDFYEDEEDEDDEDDDDYEYDDDEDFFEVTCPNCSEKIYVDDDVLDEGSVECPKCNKKLEFHVVDECDCCEDDE